MKNLSSPYLMCKHFTVGLSCLGYNSFFRTTFPEYINTKYYLFLIVMIRLFLSFVRLRSTVFNKMALGGVPFSFLNKGKYQAKLLYV